jgi:hypothetical protein
MSKSGPRDETEAVQILLRTRVPVSRGFREAQQCYTVPPYTSKEEPLNAVSFDSSSNNERFACKWSPTWLTGTAVDISTHENWFSKRKPSLSDTADGDDSI